MKLIPIPPFSYMVFDRYTEWSRRSRLGISSWFTRDEIEDMLPHRYRNLDFIPQLSVIIGTGPFEMFEALKKVLEEEL